MEFRILGPLEVCDDAGVVALGGPLPRALLALLLLHANRPVAAARLAGALWGDDASESSGRTLQVYISRLRKALRERDRLVIGPGGYLVRVLPGELDAERFERGVTDGLDALAAGQLEPAASGLREALSLWRGPVLAELASVWLAPAEVASLEERRLVAVEALGDAQLGLGRDAELVVELQELVAEHPWRERLHAQLMLALYRAGRQADALAAYRHTREVLVEQLGIEPGRELQELHRAVLAQDPVLGAPRDARDPASRRSLPLPPNRTIGREYELSALVEQFHRSRLVTLTGPGGVGKTRLALEVARLLEADFAHGAQLVSLAALARPDDVPAAIVDALGVTVLAGESPDQAAMRFLAAKHLLLLLDNCEHLPGAAAFIGGLLESCPRLSVLATSREPLALQAEQRFPVPPLTGAPAAALFRERAQGHDPQFAPTGDDQAAVTEICRRVDGLPLAIELAAARCGLLSASEIAERLDSALARPATSDAPPRQQTLRATIDWSHALLDEREREAFAGFAVFAGGASVPATEFVTGAGLATLERLVAKSLLVRHAVTGGATRLGMLEMLRAYAGERLEGGHRAAIRERHYRVHLALAQTHGTDRSLMTAGRREQLARLDVELDNFRVALEWAVARPDAEPALALCAALGRYWLMRDRYAEAVRWIDAALRRPGAENHPELRARVLCIKTLALWTLGRGAEQSAVHAEAVATARTLADPLVLAQTLWLGADHAVGSGELDLAEALADEAWHWASAAGDAWEMAQASSRKAMAASNLSELRERIERAATRLEAVGNVYQLADMFAGCAYGAVLFGGDEDALQLVKRALPLMRELDDPYLWMMLQGNLGLAALLTGDSETADAAFREELRLCRELVVLPLASEGLVGLAALAALRGEPRRAARLVGASEAHRYGESKDAVDARLDALFLAEARQRCGPDAWRAEVRGGAALSFDDAISDALSLPDA